MCDGISINHGHRAVTNNTRKICHSYSKVFMVAVLNSINHIDTLNNGTVFANQEHEITKLDFN